MEREIVELRRQVAQQTGILQNNGLPNGASNLSLPQSAYAHDAAAGLLDLRSGIEKSPGRAPVFKRLEDVALTTDRIQELHKRFFTLFSPFLPFLNPERTPDEFYQRSPLLFWTIVTIGARQSNTDPELFPALIQPLTRLVWATMADIPQNYHVVKALILLCAWPLPTSSTSTDPTLMFCGLMMKIALQIGLHRPSHAQDFTKFRIELREIELQDRVVVWSVCNIVAQRICTSYGQPSMTVYDWTLGPKPIENNPNYELPTPILTRLLIEKFVDKVSRTLYMSDHDPVGLAPDNERRQYVSLLSNSYADLEDRLRKDASPITRIYLKAAALHMWLSAFFSPPSLPSYREDMLKLYNATTEFLEACLSLENESSVSLASSYTHGLSLACGTNYIFHMMLAAGFSLLKLMHNFLSQVESDTRGASELLTRTLWALRSMSVVDNDLAERLSEVLAQVWKSGRVRAEPSHNIGDQSYDDSLQLKVKCRMSMSLVFDSVWRWRKNFKFQGGKPSERQSARVRRAVADDSTVRESNADLQVATRPASRTGTVIGRQPSNQAVTSTSIVPGMAGMSTGMLDDFAVDYNQANYEVFDPLNWMLDGTVEFPFSFNPGQGVDGGMDVMDNGI
jgi:Fungal specific transcription factor domain